MPQPLRILLLSWTLLTLALPAAAAPAPAATPEASKVAGVQVAAKEELKKDGYQILAGVLTVTTAFAGLVPKMFESVSVMSRRKRDLQRIEDLTGLMQKIHTESHLSETTLQQLSAQIEAELVNAARGLERARHRQQEAVIQRDHPDLSLPARLLLLYQPLGFRAGLSHYLAYVSVVMGVLMAYVAGMDEDNAFKWQEFKNFNGWIFLVLAIILGGMCSMWALSERKRWQRSHPGAVIDPLPAWRRQLLLFAPRSVSGWVAVVGNYAILLCWLALVPAMVSDLADAVAFVILCAGLLAPLRNWAPTRRWCALQASAAHAPA